MKNCDPCDQAWCISYKPYDCMYCRINGMARYALNRMHLQWPIPVRRVRDHYLLYGECENGLQPYISSSQLKHQKIARCSSSQISQLNKLSTSCCWGVTSKMVNNAKFFGNPATPSWRTFTSTLQVGQRILSSAVSNCHRQRVQKLCPHFSIRGQRFWSS